MKNNVVDRHSSSARVLLDAAGKQTVRKQRLLQDPDFRTHLLPLSNVV
jgi:hypothetical protein